MFHGYGSSRSEIIPEATAFYNLQYNVFMIDFRAHGSSEGDICSMGYFEANDVRAAYNYIKAAGEKNIVFTSRWDNYPDSTIILLNGKASHAWFFMAGSTNPM